MIVYKNKEFRNLQEQVYKNMSDIANLKSSGIVLDEFGIKVVGQESSVANMPTVADYKENNPDWAYGDAYAIGTEPPYDLYILTREDANHVEDYWFNIGEFPAPGPQGEQGETGATGPQGPTGPSGADGLSAGFGVLTATAVTLQPNEQATVTVTEDGPNTAKNLSFTFGIPKGEKGDNASVEWGDITGTITDQTDLVNTLQTKQNTLVSGTNIKTINNTSILGSGNITISGSKPEVSDFTEGTGISISEDSVNDTVEIAVDTTVIPTISSLSSVAFSGSYADLSNKPTIPTKVSDLTNDSGYITSSALSGYATETWVTSQGYAESADLATVATSGSYNDLTDKPTIPVVDYPVTDVQVNSISVVNASGVAEIDLTDYVESSDLATVATTGDYDDLIDKPTIPTATSDLTNDSGFITSSALSGYATETWVGQQGYLTSVAWGDVTGKPTFATVATSGSYNDLSNKPTIPAEYVIITKDLSDYEFTSSDISTIQANIGRCAIKFHLDNYGGSPFDMIYLPVYDYEEDQYMDFYCVGGYIDGDDWPHTNQNCIDILRIDYSSLNNDITYTFTHTSIPSSSNFVTLTGAQTISGVKTFAAEGIKIRGQDLGNVSLKGPLVNNAYVATFPSKSGTIAMTSDIPTIPTNYVTTDTAQSITATKTFVDTDIYLQKSDPLDPETSLNVGQLHFNSNNDFEIYADGEINLTSGNGDPIKVEGVQIATVNDILGSSTETWTFTLSDDTTTTKTVVLA